MIDQEKKTMKYKKANFKYILMDTYTRKLHGNFPEISTDYFNIKDGTITIYKGYAWDGATGIAINTTNTLKGSLTHDCLYQGIRLGKLDNKLKLVADREMFNILIEDGMCPIRAIFWYLFLRCSNPFTCKRALDRDVILEV